MMKSFVQIGIFRSRKSKLRDAVGLSNNSSRNRKTVRSKNKQKAKALGKPVNPLFFQKSMKNA